MKSKIEWTDRTWNPVRGCSRVSEGCRNCYAERQAARFSAPGETFHGFVRWKSRVSGLQYAERGAAGGADPVWTGRVELIPEKLAEPLSWRKPSRVFVNSMSDLFHEALPDAAIDRVFAVMALAPQHTFQVLTKRPERMRAYMARLARSPGCADHLFDAARVDGRRIARLAWPLQNVWLGVSVENQATADERIPHLLATPAAVRFVSAEPLIGPVDLGVSRAKGLPTFREADTFYETLVAPSLRPDGSKEPGRSLARPGRGWVPWRVTGATYLDWVIVGGESGPGARPCDVAWIRSAVAQCRAAGVPCFVKQLGARPESEEGCRDCDQCSARQRCTLSVPYLMRLRDRKGGDPSEWPEDLRVREFPQ